MSNENGTGGDDENKKDQHVIPLRGRRVVPTSQVDDGSEEWDFVSCIKIMPALNGGYGLCIDYSGSGLSDLYLIKDREELLGLIHEIFKDMKEV